MTHLGGIQQAEKKLDKNVLQVKDLVKKWEIYQKFYLNKKKLLCDERNYINHTFYAELNKQLQIYDLI